MTIKNVSVSIILYSLRRVHLSSQPRVVTIFVPLNLSAKDLINHISRETTLCHLLCPQF
jgi:hypothetical protein